MRPQTHGVTIDKRWGERTESPFVILLPSGAEERQGQRVGVGARIVAGLHVPLGCISPGSPGKVSGGQRPARAVHRQAGRPEGETKMCHHVS